MEEFSLSKRDKYHQNILAKLQQLYNSFDSNRDGQYAEMLHSLQTSLYSLHVGTNAEYREKLADLEEYRDNRLVELKLWEEYQVAQAELQYKEEIEAATTEHEEMMQLVKDKLHARLEFQRKRLMEDRALLDISSDHTFFLTAANPASKARSNFSGSERRSSRRRDLGDEASGLSGNESHGRIGRSSTQFSDVDTGTDRDLDAVLRDFDRPPARNVSKSYQGVKTLKYEEGLADLALINDGVKKLKRR